MEHLSITLPENFTQFLVTASTSFTLIAIAEIGDKSQLVCMMLASRYRTLPVIFGASAAFLFLNTLAVVFGSAIAAWLPDYLIAAGIALLFAGFGFIALFNDHDDDEVTVEKSTHSIFMSTFLLITLAEFGDKTQLSVVAFSTAAQPVAIWLGSTLALIFTSALGVLAGNTLLQKIPLSLLHKISGIIFLILAAAAAYKTYSSIMAANLLPSLMKFLTWP